MITSLKDTCKIPPKDLQPPTDLLIIDGSMFVHANPPKTGTFSEYATGFAEKISKKSERYLRVDIIFDQYKNDSLKSETRRSRGDGRKCKVVAHGKVPKNWQGFLRNPSNKTDLFLLLAKSIYSIQTGLAYATIGDSSICNKVVRASIPCIHEEADTRIFVHLKHAVEKDCITTAAIHANDTDIFVLASAFFINYLK